VRGIATAKAGVPVRPAAEAPTPSGECAGVDPAHASCLQETLATALQRHRGELVLLCSFQKEESVLIDALIRASERLYPGEPVAALCRIVTIDTGVLFEETLATWRAFEEHFGVRIAVEDASASSVGVESAWSGPEHCCSVAKVAALERALAGATGWVTGLRREQSPTRANALPIERDSARGIYKYNPLAHWSEREIWRWIHARALPYHPLHDHGYASIGCAPCTRPGSGREGRWAGTEKTECGLHLPAEQLRNASGDRATGGDGSAQGS
jgi:phosphoadenosine phosphosulfate reductase